MVLDAHSNKFIKSSVVDDFDGFVSMVMKKNSYPLIDQMPIVLRPGNVNFVAISATSIKADEGIRNIDTSKRRCHFSNEQLDNLTIHNHYTQSNCILECTITHVQRNLNMTCIPWFLPPLNNFQPICDPLNTALVSMPQVIIYTFELQWNPTLNHNNYFH